MSLSKVLEIARGELGVTESPPNSNRIKYWDDYDKSFQGQPWCVAFLWWVFQQAGERMSFFGGGKTASCGTLLMWYQNMEQTVPVSEVQVGDIVILNFHGTMDTEHCGLVEETHWHQDASLDWVETIEGNTTASAYGSQDNGGCVSQKRRYPGQIVGVCRPQYKPEEPEKIDDWSGHHAADAIRWGKEIGLLQGYPDGSMRPNEPIPMWRMLTILKRYDDYRFGGSRK